MRWVSRRLTDFSQHTLLGLLLVLNAVAASITVLPIRPGKALDPKQLMLDLRAGLLAKQEGEVVGNVVDQEILWQCVTWRCLHLSVSGRNRSGRPPFSKCVAVKLPEASSRPQCALLFDNLERSGNPWKYPQSEATDFIVDNKFPRFQGT